MSIVTRTVGLAAVYLLVLTSAAPGDVLVGLALGLVVALALGDRRPSRPRVPWHERLAAATIVAVQTGAEMVRGSWRVARFCLGGSAAPGFVELPRDGRSVRETALWGVLTGEAPDEIPVDAGPDVLVVHLVHADDPDGVRARHAAAHERQRTVVR